MYISTVEEVGVNLNGLSISTPQQVYYIMFFPEACDSEYLSKTGFTPFFLILFPILPLLLCPTPNHSFLQPFPDILYLLNVILK